MRDSASDSGSAEKTRSSMTVVDLLARKARDQKDYERRLKTIEVNSCLPSSSGSLLPIIPV